MKRLAFLAFLTFALAACAGTPGAPPAPSAQAVPPAPPLEAQIGELKASLFVLIGEERAKLGAGAKPLVLDAELAEAAQAHSADMAKKRSFDTMNASGNIGVNALLADPNFHGLVGENAAAQYFTPQTGFDPEKMARGFVDIWLNSPSHKSNLMDPAFARTGIGVAANGNILYAAELFASEETP